jgi:threonine dehydrogenase-like Zn-dependent dehydrogenase
MIRAGEIGQALWYSGAGQAEIRAEKLPLPGPDELRVRAVWSAISRGTEALIFAGRVPPSEFARMRAPFMAGNFPFPVKYGYAMVGTIETGSADLIGRNVFVLHPHQTLFNVPRAAVALLPDEIPPRRAVLAANMETALNAVWDGAPGPADRIAIVGAGVIGTLVAFLCARMPGAEVTLVDVVPARTEIARTFGVAFATPDNAPTECDCVFHASGSAAGLATAISCAGDEATIVELSWHGADTVPVPLGAAFHSRRLRLVSSQVGRVSGSRRPRWTTARRLAAAIRLLQDHRLDALIAAPLQFCELPARLPEILGARSGVLCQLVAYN